MKKKLIMLIAIAALLTQVTILPANTAFANNKPIEIEGKLVNGRVLIPLRAFSENMGSKVQWDNKEKMAYIQKENKVISLELNGTIISIDGLPNGYLLDVPMTMIGQTTYVPFSYMSSVMGASVTWNNQIKQAKVMNKDNSILLINAKPDHSVTLPTAPSQKRLDQLYAKVNEAANITAYTQKRQQLTGYFTNEFINQVIYNNGLTELDKNYAHDFNEPMLIYSPESVYSAVMFQAISIAERNEYNTGTLTRDIVLKFVDGQWLVSEVITALK